MKKLIVLSLVVCATLFGAYKIGDKVTDFNFQDTNLDGTTIVTYDHSIYGLTGTDKKAVLITFFYPG